MYDRNGPCPPQTDSPEDQPLKRRKAFSTPAELPELRPSLWPPPSSETTVSCAASSSSMEISNNWAPHEDEYITFISITGKRYQWPFGVCQKWQVCILSFFIQIGSLHSLNKQEMKRLIACAHGADPENSSTEDDHYELHNSDNYVILKEVWEKVLKPGEIITMHWSQQPQIQIQPQLLLSPPPLPPLPPSPSPSGSQTLAPSVQEPAISEDLLGPLDDPSSEPPLGPQPLTSEDLIELDVPDPEPTPTPTPPPPSPSPPPLHPPPEPQKPVAEPKDSSEATILPPLSFKFGDKTYTLPFNGCRTWQVRTF
jgi:hypothetical protein